MFERILAAVDDSARSALVTQVARALALRSGAALTLLRVRPDTERDQVNANDLELAEETRALREAGVAAHYLIHIGAPEQQIIETASRQRATLIIVGARGASAWPLLSQRMSQRLAIHAPAPVLVIPAADAEATMAEARQRGDVVFGADDAPIVAPLDGSDLAEQALPFAVELARLLDRPLLLLRVAPLLYSQGEMAHAWSYIEGARRRVRERYARDLRVEAQVVSGAPIEETLWAIEGRRAGALILMQYGRQAGSLRRASPISRELLSKLPIPTLIIPVAALTTPANADDADNVVDVVDGEDSEETERVP
jgi:nucleotide-binding universal stress UspA family protein